MIERSFWALRQSAGSQSGGVALKKICLNELEEFIVFEQPAKPLPTRVRTPARAWGPSRRGSWDRIYRLSLRWLRLSRDCEQQNPSSTGPFRTRNYLAGADLRDICQWLGISARTVYRYKDLQEPPPRPPYKKKASVLDPWVPYLLKRWNEGCHNGKRLYREICEQGYTTS